MSSPLPTETALRAGLTDEVLGELVRIAGSHPGRRWDAVQERIRQTLVAALAPLMAPETDRCLPQISHDRVSRSKGAPVDPDGKQQSDPIIRQADPPPVPVAPELQLTAEEQRVAAQMPPMGAFVPFAIFDKELDCARVQWRDCSVIEKRIDERLTLMFDNYDETSCVGFVVKGIAHAAYPQPFEMPPISPVPVAPPAFSSLTLTAQKNLRFCAECGLTRLDDGLNPIDCPYCESRMFRRLAAKLVGKLGVAKLGLEEIQKL